MQKSVSLEFKAYLKEVTNTLSAYDSQQGRSKKEKNQKILPEYFGMNFKFYGEQKVYYKDVDKMGVVYYALRRENPYDPSIPP